MKRPEYVLFDCDGVLVDSEPITNVIMRDNLARHGLELDLDQIFEMFVGGTMKGVMTRGRELGADLPDNWLDQIYACLLYTSPSPRDLSTSRMPSSA